MLDRFEMRLDVDRHYDDLLPNVDDHATATTVASRVAQARSRATARGVRHNAALTSAQLDATAPLNPSARALIERALWTGQLTGRGVHGVRRVALTIADLSGGEPPLTEHHMAAALALRAPILRHATD